MRVHINTLATSCKELTHWKRPWCWEGLGAGRDGDNRGWDGWMASLTRWTWVWVNSGSWWWTRRPGVLWFTGSQRVRHNWVTELDWTEPDPRNIMDHTKTKYKSTEEVPASTSKVRTILGRLCSQTIISQEQLQKVCLPVNHDFSFIFLNFPYVSLWLISIAMPLPFPSICIV